MNKVYKVIWNASIGAWVATSEIAKSKTKTKSKTLNISAAVLSGVICFAPNAFAGTNTEGGVGQGTSISGTTSCREGSANTANQKDIAIGCGAQTQDRTGSNIANRNNPYNNSTGAYAGAMKQGGAISVGTGAVVEKGLGTAIGSYATTQGISGVAIGTGALSSGNTALAVGRQSAATADFSQAIGNVAAATGKGSLAIGHSATAEGYRSIAIGSPDIENADPVAGQAGAAYQPKMATKATGKDSIAFGGGAIATEENALAIGAFSESKGKKSVAIGTGAKAQKDNAVVIGDQAEASFEGGVAIGKGARSEAENSIALGKDSKASQATGESFLTKQSAPTGVLSIGDVGSERRIQNVADGAADSDAATVRQLKAARTHYVSINDNGQPGGNFENDGATGRNAIAVGVNASAAGREAMAIGGNAQAIGSGAIAMGSSSQTVGRGDVAIGRNASTQGAEGVNSNQSVAIGDQTKAIGDQSVAIGADVIAKGNSSVAIGGDDVDKIARDTELSNTYTEITGGTLQAGKYPTTEANHGSTAVGVQAVGTGAFSSAFGMTSKATGDASSAFGVMSNASGKGAAAFGAVAQATGDGASAMGINSLASGTNSTAIGSGNKPGEGAKATGNSSAAIGSGALATGDNSAAIGKGAEATNENAAAVGGGAKATGKNATAIGGGAIADQENAVAVGQGAQSLVEGGVALGARSKVEAKNSVALGQDAVATEATGTSFLTNRDASQSNGVISVGSAGKERRITNVEDGSADSDAVTVRQLKNVDGRVNQNTSNISKNAQNITNLNQKLDDTKTDLGNQITDTNKNLNDAKKDLGDQIADTNTKLNTTKDQLTTQINDTKTELNNTIGNTKTELNSKIDNTKTELENKGLNFAGNSGADVHRKLGEKLNIVGGAAASTPAATTSGENVITRTTKDGIQIELLKDSKFDSVTTGNTTLNTNGLTIKEGPSITKEGINAGGKHITNVADGVNAKDAVNVDQLTKVKENLNGRITDTNNQLNDAKKDLGNQIADTNKNLNDAKKDLGNQIADTNTKLNNTKDQLTTQINDTKTELNNTIGNTKTELNSKIDNTKTELENKGLNFAGNSGTDIHRKLGEKLNIIGGAAASTPAAKTSGENVITRTTKDGIQIELLKDSKFDSVTTGNTTLNTNGLTIKEGPSITKQGINAGSKQITNVADGVNAKDAVNVDQLTKVKENLNGKITDTNNQLNDAKKDLGNQIADTNKNLNDAKKDLGNQIIDTNTKLNTTKDQLTTQINDTKTELNNTIGNTKTELNSKIDSTKNELENKGLNFAGNSGSDVHRKLGEKLNIVGGAAASTPAAKSSGENVITRTTKDGIQIELLKDSKFDSVTTGNTTLNTNGLTIKEGPSITKEGINAGGKQITNVADGINAKDAVNKSQLDNLAAKQNATDDAAVKYDDAKTKDKVTLKGRDGTVLDNVKAGHISSTSKEAVNGSQIHKISNSIKNSIGGNTVVNPDGSLTTNNIGGTGKNNINDAISEVKNTAMKAKTTVTEGDNIVVKETVNKDGSTNYEVATKKDLTLNSVTTGDTVLNNNGLTIKDGPSITKDGINASGKQITNVADGINAKDAVNVDQLTKVKENLNGRITDTNNQLNDAKKDLGNQIADTNKNLNDAKKDLGNQITDTNTKLNTTKDQLTTQINDTKTELNNTIGNTKTELNSKIDSTKNELENKGLNFAGNSGSDVHRKLGEKLNIVGGAAASTPAAKTSGENVITRTTKDGIQIELLKDSKFDSVTTGNTTLNTNGLTIKEGPSVTKEGINAGGKQITNVADGVNAKDAVNKSQLDNLAAKQNATDDAAVKYDDAKTKDKVTLKGKDGTVLDNVNAGHISSTSKEAVNGSQIHKISNSIKNSIGGNTVVNPDGSLTTSNIGGTGKNNINDAISEVKNTAMKAKTTVTEGDNIVVKETVNKDGSTNYEVATKKDLTLNSVTTGDTVLNNNGLTIKDGPSITKQGINAGSKKITDVANGVIAQNSKDAVNGGQVHHISNSIKTSIGGNTVVNPDGSLTTNNIGGTGKNNINDAIKSVDEKVTNGVNDLTQKGLNFGANDQKATQGKAVHRKLGDTINIVGGADAKTAEDKTSGENIITRTTEDGVKIEMLKDVKFDSVNVGGHVLNQQGLTIKGGPSITVNGINAGGKQITNVADGINAKDAVNKGQLDKQINEVKDQIGKDIGKLSDHAVQYDKDKNGNVDKNSVTLGGGDKGTNLKNVADGKVAEGSKDAVNGGQLWNVQNQVDKNSNDIKNIQNNIDNISNGKAGLVQQQKPNGEITVGKDTGGTSINMAGKEGDRVVQGVKDGEIKAGSNQAVNGGQIHKISESIKNSIGGNTTIDPKDGSITTNNIGGTGKNNINDAIGTLNQSNQELGNKITNLGDQLQQVFYDTNKRIDDVEKKANAGIAAAMALENAPFVAGKYTYAVGAAYHGGENAVGVTLRKTSDNGRWSITGGVAAASQGEPSVRVGISGVIN
ncbi:trimeric autotransporter adhesin Ata [Acinetobacter baumannii]|uniref:trimeric autotransporter adhesin Ata n=15 Tax=Acinetobacter TaxID=469 RepID=UPI0020BF57AF|nr:trimeric autotransporter adhesin Ata [Acinetobacter baumannii]MCL6167068.1 trimeric autotransporter adhesin Ata [Acinetobacter baumannii]MCL6170811.1 trimeric autotransporter adhesin Ata [Acinetobacter baumannii]MCL6174235.1 trimeric autotransporter adhesin Ata [Acinetobacter baumannii]MCL6195080.1 trimeric autotransporter adhesin Ata [Acinetobacter baumannii]MCL6198506.1 trimeric autotransporter adhesin Ata [Acinetobacter baumannii]